MKSKASIISILLVALLTCAGSVFAQKSAGKGAGRGEGVGKGVGVGKTDGTQKQQTVASTKVTQNVNVMLTTSSGKISVRGWDSNELRAQTKEAGAKIELRKAAGPDEASPATRVEILVSAKSEDKEPDDDSCYAEADITVDVPRGAIVYLKTEDGDVDVEDIGEAHIATTGGRIDLRRVTTAAEAASVGGDVTLEDSSGRARLSTIGGVIAVRDLRSSSPGDSLKIVSAGGDILLDRVGIPRVETSSISGMMKMSGPLARGGTYKFTSTIGDITLVLGADSSFKLTSKVSEGGEIITDFPLKYKGSTSPFTLLHAGTLVGEYGSGDASITMVSFSGTLRLRKK